MELLPLIYFCFLTLYLYKKSNEITIAVYMASLYLLSSLCCFILVKYDLYDTLLLFYNVRNLELNFVPTVLYCVLITLTILPFAKIDSNYIKSIYVNNRTFYKCLFYLFVAVFLLTIYRLGDGLNEVMNGDLAAMRAAHYAGDSALESTRKIPFPLNYLNYFKYCSILALPCFFFSICFQNKSIYHNLTLFLASLSMPINAIISIDRTEMVYYLQMFIFCFIIFRPFIKKQAKRTLTLFTTPIVAVFLLYIGMVSISRFGDNNTGSGGVAVEYAGQNYLNFCHFYEDRNQESFNTLRVFPLFHAIMFDEKYTEEFRTESYRTHRFSTGIFASFIGDLVLDIGIIPTIIWVLFYAIICNYILSRETNKRKSLGLILVIVVFGSIPIFGIFYMRYFHMQSSILIVVSIISLIFLKYKLKH